MKDKQFIDAVFVQVDKMCRMRNEIIQKEHLEICRRLSHDYGFRGEYILQRNREDDFSLLDLSNIYKSIGYKKEKLQYWSKNGTGGYRDDCVLREVKKTIEYLDYCIGNQFTSRKVDSKLIEIKDNLESLLVMSELELS